MLRRLLLPAGLTVALASVVFAGKALMSSFLSAGAGVPVPFQLVPLPPVKVQRAPISISPQAQSAFSPSLNQLLNGETVITTEKQMEEVWNRIFAGPFDASLFDFSTDFVVLMGAGKLTTQSFDISAVERVDAMYSDFAFFGPVPDPFLAVTSTLLLPGVFPKDPPPGMFVVSAARVSKSQLDDVVFHRSVIPLP